MWISMKCLVEFTSKDSFAIMNNACYTLKSVNFIKALILTSQILIC